MAAIAGFLDQWVFGHDRAAMLAAQIPAASAEQAAARQRQEAHLTAELARIATAQAGLFTELERLGADTSAATQAYRQRIQARHAELHDEHTRTQAQLDDLAAAAIPDQDPALLDELPYLASQLADAPADLVEALIDALDIQILYRPEQHQATIWATLTDTTPSIAGRCDGLVVLARTAPFAMIKHVATRIPVVLLATEEDQGRGDRAIDFLAVANETGAYQVTAHLADVHGYTDICSVAGPPDSAGLGPPLDGFRRATAGLVSQHDVLIYYGDFTTAGGRRVAERILGTGRVPRALVCANDQTAIGVMVALQHEGLSVPGDVAVTGVDGIRLGRHLRPSLTTVVQPMAALGETAVAMLEDRIGGVALPQRTVELPVRLELRGSCGCAQ